MANPPLKPVVWVGDSLERLKGFPADVQDEVGYALYLAQCGGSHQAAKPLKGLGAGVIEVVSDHRGDTFRAVYTVRLAGRLYVLHNGSGEPARCTSSGSDRVANKKDYIVGSGNVFADLDRPRPAEALAKAELARKIGGIIERRRLTQAVAATLLGIDQPKVSALTRGRLSGFSLDRLVRFLVLLGSDVRIVVKARSRGAGRARLLVA